MSRRLRLRDCWSKRRSDSVCPGRAMAAPSVEAFPDVNTWTMQKPGETCSAACTDLLKVPSQHDGNGKLSSRWRTEFCHEDCCLLDGWFRRGSGKEFRQCSRDVYWNLWNMRDFADSEARSQTCLKTCLLGDAIKSVDAAPAMGQCFHPSPRKPSVIQRFKNTGPSSRQGGSSLSTTSRTW